MSLIRLLDVDHYIIFLQDGDFYDSEYSSSFTSAGPVTSPIVDPGPAPPNMVPLIVGPIGGCVVIGLVIAIIVITIRRKKTQKKEKAPEPTKVVIDQPPTYPNDPVELRRMNFSTPGKLALSIY